MPTKTLHGVTLWAVPRFHRSEITPENSETGTEWVNRLKTYSFSLGQDEGKAGGKAAKPPPGPTNLKPVTETCLKCRHIKADT